jgi:hypothetical protein
MVSRQDIETGSTGSELHLAAARRNVLLRREPEIVDFGDRAVPVALVSIRQLITCTSLCHVLFCICTAVLGAARRAKNTLILHHRQCSSRRAARI